MGWWTLDREPDGTELFCGDLPLDVFGIALADIAHLFQQEYGRNPTRAELEAVCAEVFDCTEPVLERAPVREAPPVRAGALFLIPYTDDGQRCCWGRVLAMTEEGTAWIVVLDLDVAPEPDLDQVARAPWLLGPIAPGYGPFDEGAWPIVGHRPIRDDEPMPIHRVTKRRQRKWVECLVDIDGRELAPGEAARSILVSQSVGGDAHLVRTLRAVRRHEAWRPYMADTVFER